MPLKFLWGDEDFLIEKAVKKIKNEVLKGEVSELNFKTYDSPNFALFSELLRTNAMMFGDTLIVIKCQNYFLPGKNKSELDEKQVQQLIDALNSINEKVHIVLLCPTPRGEKKKPDSRKKLFKEVQKLTNPEEYPSYRPYEENKLIPIIKTFAKELGIKISDNDCSYLIQTTGASLRDLYTQLEKIKLYIYPDTIVSQNAIKNIATQNIDVFGVIDYVLKKEYTRAINLIAGIIEKEHYLSSLALLQTSISNLLKIKILSTSMNSYDISIKVGLHKFVVDKNLEKLFNVPIKELVRLKTNLTIVDYMLKTGKITDPLIGYELAFLSDDLEGKID